MLDLAAIPAELVVRGTHGKSARLDPAKPEFLRFARALFNVGRLVLITHPARFKIKAEVFSFRCHVPGPELYGDGEGICPLAVFFGVPNKLVSSGPDDDAGPAVPKEGLYLGGLLLAHDLGDEAYFEDRKSILGVVGLHFVVDLDLAVAGYAGGVADKAGEKTARERENQKRKK